MTSSAAGAARTGPALTRRRLLKQAVLGGLVLTVAGCSSDPEVGPNMGAPPGGRELTVENFGAIGDGTTEDGPAVQRALDALGRGDRLSFTAGRTYAHSEVLLLGVSGVTLAGTGMLLAQNEERSSLRVEAEDVTVEDLRLGVRETTRRWDAPDQHRFYARLARGLILRRLVVTGSAASGVFLDGVSDFRLEDVEVADTRADGIHLSRGTHSGSVQRSRSLRTGDDGVAVVSYLEDGGACHNIEIVAPVVRTTTGGRGLSVVGGEDITYRNIDVEDSAAAAVYVACEGEPYFTEPTRRVMVLGGRIRGANRDAEIDHGAVLVYGGRDDGEVTEVVVSGLDIQGTRPGASRQVGVVRDGGTIESVRFEGLAVQGQPEPFTSNASGGCCTLAAWTIDGQAAVVSP